MSIHEKAIRWKAALKADPIDWLLEEDNASVRYLTLIDLLNKSPSSPEVIKAKQLIINSKPVNIILGKQEAGGHWGIPEYFYVHAKYKGTVWNIITLAEMGVDGSDERVRKAGEFILNNAQDRQSGGFAHSSGKDGGGDHAKVIPCLTGNMVFSLIRFGFLEDPRLQKAIEWIVRYQRFDDGEEPAPKGWPYDRYRQCFGKHSCMMGVVKSLKALVEIPPAKRSKSITNTIEQGAEYLLKHHLYKQSHNTMLIANEDWTHPGFPLMWKTDVLEMLDILTRSGYYDTRMQNAIDLIISKQDEQGRWLLEKTFNGRTLVKIESKGKPSQWVTMNALKVLKNWNNRQ